MREKWGFLELLASMTDSCQTSHIATHVLGDRAWVSSLVSTVKVWYLLEPRFVYRQIVDMSDVRYAVCLQPHWSTQAVYMCPGFTHQTAKTNKNNLQILPVNLPSAKIFKAVEVHFETNLPQSYKCLRLSWTNNLVFGKAWVYFSAQFYTISH